MNLDQELRDALARREPPLGFAARLEARLPRHRPVPWYRHWALAATLAVAIVGGGVAEYTRERERRMAAQRSGAELEYALSVTSTTLQKVQKQLKDTL